MPGLVVNAAQAMKDREPLEPGEYHATFTNSKVRDASGPDSYPMVMLEFTVAEDEGEFAGRKAFRSLSAKPEAVPFMIDAAIALGADPDEVVQPSVDMEAVFNELRGADCYIRTSIREFTRNGNTERATNIDTILTQATS